MTFCLFTQQKKKNQTQVKVDVADTDVPSSIKEPEGDEACVQEASSTPSTPVSLATEQQAETEDVEEKSNLPSPATEPKEPEGDGACVQEASSTLETPVSGSTEPRAETEDAAQSVSSSTEAPKKKAKKACWLCRLFGFEKKKMVCLSELGMEQLLFLSLIVIIMLTIIFN